MHAMSPKEYKLDRNIGNFQKLLQYKDSKWIDNAFILTCYF